MAPCSFSPAPCSPERPPIPPGPRDRSTPWRPSAPSPVACSPATCSCRTFRRCWRPPWWRSSTDWSSLASPVSRPDARSPPWSACSSPPACWPGPCSSIRPPSTGNGRGAPWSATTTPPTRTSPWCKVAASSPSTATAPPCSALLTRTSPASRSSPTSPCSPTRPPAES